MWTAIKAVFGVGGVGETALKIVEKLTGTDDTPDKKREFFLAYMDATKHQSIPRRMIATAIALAWLLMIFTWVIASVIGRFAYDAAINSGTILAADISAFMQLNISEPMNIVLVFYFATQVLSGLKK